MNFVITGSITVRSTCPEKDRDDNVLLDENGKPVYEEVTFHGSDFGWEDGEGIRRNDEGDLYCTGVWKAFHDYDMSVEITVYAYFRGACRTFQVDTINCVNIDDNLDYEFQAHNDEPELY